MTTTQLTGRRKPMSERGPLDLLREGIHDLSTRRRLVRHLVSAEMKRTHADTAIGTLWWVIDPILQMAVYWVLVAVIFHRTTPDILLFLFTGILPWKWFSTSLGETATSVVSRVQLIKQINFPKIVLPAAATLAAGVSFSYGVWTLIAMYALYPHRLTFWVLALPLVAVVQFVFTLAIGIALAAVNAFFRDVQNVMRHAVRLWFYLTPVLYPLDSLEKSSLAHRVLSLNPMAPIIEAYRAILYGDTVAGSQGMAPNVQSLVVTLAFSVVLLLIAIIGFKRVEPAFARIL
jgi:lipopolysaccharide transport system permease protein